MVPCRLDRQPGILWIGLREVKLLKELDRKGEKIEAFEFKEVVAATEEEMTKIPIITFFFFAVL